MREKELGIEEAGIVTLTRSRDRGTERPDRSRERDSRSDRDRGHERDRDRDRDRETKRSSSRDQLRRHERRSESRHSDSSKVPQLPPMCSFVVSHVSVSATNYQVISISFFGFKHSFDVCVTAVVYISPSLHPYFKAVNQLQRKRSHLFLSLSLFLHSYQTQESCYLLKFLKIL